jgi:pyruvate kinase
VALSFVQSAEDVVRARAVASAATSVRVPIVAKIERPEAAARIHEILDAADGVMVARGDLGLELPLEQVPRLQKQITYGARSRGIPVIVATQVFDSMRTEPRPTRAEVSDAANAVDDGADAIMLAGETAVGAYPVRAVETLDLVIRDAERMEPAHVPVGPTVVDVEHNRALCQAAVELASSARASAIVAVTRGGKTARVLSAFRPGVPVFAATPRDDVARRLALHRGVQALTVPFGADTDGTARSIDEELVRRRLLAAGDVIVFVSVTADLTTRDANYVQVQQIGR